MLGKDGKLVQCVQESFLKQCMEGSTKECASVDILLGSEVGQVTEMSVIENFGTIICLFLNSYGKDKTGPQVTVLNWGKDNFGVF